MPKYGIHHIVLDETVEKLKNGNSNARDAAMLLEENPFAANLGSIGPDLFFFASDYDIISQLNLIMPVLEFLDEIEERIEKVLEPIEEIEKMLDNTIDTVLDTLGIDILNRIANRIDSIEDLINALLNQSIQSVLLQNTTPLQTDTSEAGQSTSPLARIVRELYENYLMPPLQNNYEEVDWYWFDMLHYRNVGDFAKNLLDLADTDRKKAYVLAYLTHIGTDLVGHPYVNQIVGGPFRLGVQRHVTAENFMDVFAYQAKYGRAVNQTLYTDLGFDDDASQGLVQEIAQLLVDAARATYHDVAHPVRLDGDGFFTPDDVEDAFKLLRVALKFMGNVKELRPEPVLDSADVDLAEIIDAINGFDPPPLPPNLLPDRPDFTMEALFNGEITLADINAALIATDQSFNDWFDSWVGYIGEFTFYCLQTGLQLARLARSLIQISANATGRPLLVLLYGVQLALYDMYKASRYIVALNGLTYPDADMIDDSVAKSLITIADDNLQFVYVPGADAKKHNNKFPTLRVKGQSHLLAPFYADECQLTIPAFHRPNNNQPVVPSAFIRDESFSAANLQRYADAASPAASQALRDQGLHIGNAVAVCAWLIEHAHSGTNSETVFANWNLDGDRGYAAQSWTGIVPHNDDNSAIIQLAIAQASDTGLFSTNNMFQQDGTIAIPDDNTGYQGTCQANDDATDYAFAKIKAKQERLDMKRSINDFLIANMLVAESNVPDVFRTYTTRDANAWIRVLAPRLTLSGNSWRENCYYINGVGTSAYDALYERYNLEHFFCTGSNDELHIKLLYNFTDNSLPFMQMGATHLVDEPAFQDEIISSADGLQAIQDKLWSYIAMWRVLGGTTLIQLHNNMANASLSFAAATLPSIENATTIAVIALLHDGMHKQKPLGLIGYSHGTQILLNGLLAFAFQGQPERDYLKRWVKVFFIGRMITQPSVVLLRRLVLDLRDLVNPGDIVPSLISNLPPDVEFLRAMSQVEVNLRNESVHSALLEFVHGIDEEQHKMYLYALRIKNASPSHRSFF